MKLRSCLKIMYTLLFANQVYIQPSTNNQLHAVMTSFVILGRHAHHQKNMMSLETCCILVCVRLIAAKIILENPQKTYWFVLVMEIRIDQSVILDNILAEFRRK